MFRKSSIPIAIAAVVALFATSNLNAQYELVKVIEDRQSLMFDMQTSYWPLLAIKRGTSSDLAAAAVAAQSMNKRRARSVRRDAPARDGERRSAGLPAPDRKSGPNSPSSM